MSWPAGHLAATFSDEGKASAVESFSDRVYESAQSGGVPFTHAVDLTYVIPFASDGKDIKACISLLHRANDAVKVSEPGLISVQTINKQNDVNANTAWTASVNFPTTAPVYYGEAKNCK